MEKVKNIYYNNKGSYWMYCNHTYLPYGYYVFNKYAMSVTVNI